MRFDGDFWLHDNAFEGRLAGLDVDVFQRHAFAARLVHVVEPRDGEFLGAQAAVADVAVAVARIRDRRSRRLIGRLLGDGRQRRVAVQVVVLDAAVVRLLPARALAVERDRLLFVHRLELRRWCRDSVDVKVRHQLGSGSEEEKKHREVEQAVEGAKQPEADQKEEEMLHDELKG